MRETETVWGDSEMITTSPRTNASRKQNDINDRVGGTRPRHYIIRYLTYRQHYVQRHIRWGKKSSIYKTCHGIECEQSTQDAGTQVPLSRRP